MILDIDFMQIIIEFEWELVENAGNCNCFRRQQNPLFIHSQVMKWWDETEGKT